MSGPDEWIGRCPWLAVLVVAMFAMAAWAGGPTTRPAAGGDKPQLIWHDEFDGNALDESKWIYRNLGPRKDGFNVKEAVRLDGNGHLVITTSKVGEKYHTGMIATQGKFQRAFGYFECRVKFQSQIGHWSAFWLQSPTLGKVVGDAGQSGTEIDIFEYLANRPGKLQHTLHWDGYGKEHKSAAQVHTQADLGEGWHTVGLDWTAERYVFCVDGKETWRTDKGVSRAPEYIILSLEVGKWAGDIAKAKLPDSVVFDYVRVYDRRPAPAAGGPPREGAPAIRTTDFLNSIGVVTTFPDRGQPVEKTIEMVKYVGFRWVRGGIEGLKDKGPTTVQTYLDLHKGTGVLFSWGLVSGGADLKKLIETAKPLADANALLAFEGNNEPNNWGVTYQGEKGGGKAPSWLAVARLHRDLYEAVKSDPVLRKYPVWSISENGAERDNVGLQFLTIPKGAGTLMPDGTRYADYANVHNYIYHPNSPGLADNKTWNAADPGPACKVDGLYGNYGLTWAKKFRGYSEAELQTLPRVTTETGCTIGGAITEEIHALNLLSVYLDQFKRGFSYTSVYLLRDRTDEGGNQRFGFYAPDYTPRKAAVYLHNLTTILADRGTLREPGKLDYSIPDEPATVHDLLLQNSDGTFQLIVWGERVKGSDSVTVNLGGAHDSVKVYDPTAGTEPVQTHSGIRSLTLTLGDHPLIVAIRANGKPAER